MHSLLQLRTELHPASEARVGDIRGYVAYLRLRRGLQVAQAVAQPLGSQAELAILLLDTGHTLEHHFIILPEQNTLQSTRTWERVRVRSARHASPLWSSKAKIDTDVTTNPDSQYLLCRRQPTSTRLRTVLENQGEKSFLMLLRAPPTLDKSPAVSIWIWDS